MILHSAQIGDDDNGIGLKTKNLARLQRGGFLVPEFVAIPSIELMNGDLALLAEEIIRILPAQSYAVRSSALVEDGAKKSYAGQFLTKIDQSAEDLESALKLVISQAEDFSGGDLEKFSIIVQVYVDADFAGVTFTRNPEGGREMVVEYHQGKGEAVVGGTIKPVRLSFYAHQNPPKTALPNFEKAVEDFQKIEKMFGFAQDIEWVVKDGKWYFLQSRAITTITESQFEEAEFLESVLPVQKDFLFEQTEISEVAPRPTLVTKNLLEKLYAAAGPVQKVYKKYGIDFTSRVFLKIVGNELYVDREEELQSILPAYSRLNSPDYKPRFCSWRGGLKTLKNLLKLGLIAMKNKSGLRDEIFLRLENPLADNFEAALKVFMKDYELIFEVNLLAQKSFKTAEIALHSAFSAKYFNNKKKPSLAELLQDRGNFHHGETLKQLPKSFATEQWVGNSLELEDENPFIFGKNLGQENFEKNSDDHLQDWLEKISPFRKKYILDVLLQAGFYNNLREHGRWLTVRHVHHLRGLLKTIARTHRLQDLNTIFFATIPEILAGDLSAETLQQRRVEYEKYNSYHLPAKLSGKPLINSSNMMGVSKGIAEGILTDITNLDSVKHPILFTKLLSPDLTKYFPQLKGIVAEQGGLLSHLAIMARESHIPAIVNVDLRRLNLKYGDKIAIDGATGEIQKIS